MSANDDDNDCLSCRIIGTGAFIGVGSYAIAQSRPLAPGTLVQKRILASLGVGGSLNIQSDATLIPTTLAFIAGGLIRWFRRPHPIQTRE